MESALPKTAEDGILTLLPAFCADTSRTNDSGLNNNDKCRDDSEDALVCETRLIKARIL
jgi:hypothetical protein